MFLQVMLSYLAAALHDLTVAITADQRMVMPFDSRGALTLESIELYTVMTAEPMNA
jgi:hypothetical protein